MTNWFKTPAGFLAKAWRGMCRKTVSLWHGTRNKIISVLRKIKEKLLTLRQKILSCCKDFGRWIKDLRASLGNSRLTTGFVAKCSELASYVDDNRKVCYPIILLIYTVVVVVITTSVNFGIVMNDNDVQGVSQLPGDMSGEMPYSVVYLEKGEARSVTDKFELCYDGYKFDKKITPSKAEKFGAYYENHSDVNMYFDVLLTYTNTSERAIRGDEAVRMTATCQDVVYNSFVAIETEQGTNFEFAADTEIRPGESVSIHCIFDVPSDMKNSSQEISVEVTADGRTYFIDIRG